MFSRDLLIIDFEATGNDPDNDHPVQLGAILLDQGTLDEKDTFSSYIKADISKADPRILAVAGVTEEDMEDAPDAATVAKRFQDKFGYNVLLSSWVEYLDRRYLEKMYKEAGIPFMDVGYVGDNSQYHDYHFLDLWVVAYTHLVKQNPGQGLHTRDIFKAFGMERHETGHDALEDCRLEAQILRKIVFSS